MKPRKTTWQIWSRDWSKDLKTDRRKKRNWRHLTWENLVLKVLGLATVWCSAAALRSSSHRLELSAMSYGQVLQQHSGVQWGLDCLESAEQEDGIFGERRDTSVRKFCIWKYWKTCLSNVLSLSSPDVVANAPVFKNTRWFKYDWDKLWLVYTQIVPVIFEPPCKCNVRSRMKVIKM